MLGTFAIQTPVSFHLLSASLPANVPCAAYIAATHETALAVALDSELWCLDSPAQLQRVHRDAHGDLEVCLST